MCFTPGQLPIQPLPRLSRRSRPSRICERGICLSRICSRDRRGICLSRICEASRAVGETAQRPACLIGRAVAEIGGTLQQSQHCIQDTSQYLFCQ
jgi:hypothetical protein